MERICRLPDLGEGIEKGDVVAVRVKAGDQVAADATLIEVESGKATVEVPTPVAGRVVRVLVEAGSTVRPGDQLVVLDAEAVTETAAPPAPATAPPPAALRPVEPVAPPPKPQPAPPATPTPPRRPPTSTFQRGPAASPSVRQLARDLGVDLAQVRPGADGRIDEAAVRRAAAGAPSGSAGNVGPAGVAVQFAEADITDLEAFRQRYAGEMQGRGVRLTLGACVARAVALAVRVHPEAVAGQAVHLAVPVAGAEGDAVIADADRLDLFSLATDLHTQVERLRAGQAPAEGPAATLSLCNRGPLGGTWFTPLPHTGHRCAFGAGRARHEGRLHQGALCARLILPLALGHDPDLGGETAARCLQQVADLLTDPYRLLLGLPKA